MPTYETQTEIASAIVRSVSHTEIVTLDWSRGREDALRVECEDSVDVSPFRAEFWGRRRRRQRVARAPGGAVVTAPGVWRVIETSRVDGDRTWRLTGPRKLRAMVEAQADGLVAVEFESGAAYSYARAEAARAVAGVLDTVADLRAEDPLDAEPTLRGHIVEVRGDDALLAVAGHFGDAFVDLVMS